MGGLLLQSLAEPGHDQGRGRDQQACRPKMFKRSERKGLEVQCRQDKMKGPGWPKVVMKGPSGLKLIPRLACRGFWKILGPRHSRPTTQASASGSDRRTELEKNEQFMEQKRKRSDEERMLLADIHDDETSHAFHLADSSQAVCQMDLPLPETSHEWRLFERDATAWAVQALRKTEVRWSSLDAEGKSKFEAAKQAEVDQWLRAEATKAVSGHVPSDRVVRMRWVRTYKDSGAAKARIVLIGFEDPDLSELVSSSPTMCRRTRQLVLQYAAQRGWKCLKEINLFTRSG